MRFLILFVAFEFLNPFAFAEDLSDLDLNVYDAGTLGSALVFSGGVYKALTAPLDYVQSKNAYSTTQTNERNLIARKEAELERLADKISPSQAKEIKVLQKELDIGISKFTLMELANKRTRLEDVGMEHFTNAMENPEYIRLRQELSELKLGIGNSRNLLRVKPSLVVQPKEATKILKGRLVKGGGISAAGLAGIFYFTKESAAHGVISSSEFKLKQAEIPQAQDQNVSPLAQPAN